MPASPVLTICPFKQPALTQLPSAVLSAVGNVSLAAPKVSRNTICACALPLHSAEAANARKNAKEARRRVVSARRGGPSSPCVVFANYFGSGVLFFNVMASDLPTCSLCRNHGLTRRSAVKSQQPNGWSSRDEAL